MTNHSRPHQPTRCDRPGMGGGSHPPRNIVVPSAATVVMLMYSARKNIPNFSDEYSVWKPPTSSPSASGRSKGARLVSPTIEVTYTRNDGSSRNTNQVPFWAATMPDVDMVPA